MHDLKKEAYGPEGDPAKHLPMAALNEGLAALPPAPREVGRLEAIVRRLPDGGREMPESTPLTLDERVPPLAK